MGIDMGAAGDDKTAALRLQKFGRAWRPVSMMFIDSHSDPTLRAELDGLQPWQLEVMRRLEANAAANGGRVVVSSVPRHTGKSTVAATIQRLQSAGRNELYRLLRIWPEPPQGVVPVDQRYRITHP